MVGFWEHVVLTYFALGFWLGVEPWQAINPRSARYMGVGAFQMIRREVYDAIGQHRRLAMEVIEDMKLGKLVKQGGYRSQVALVNGEVSVRWHAGLGNLVRGTTKNFFAASSFSLGFVSLQIFGLIADERAALDRIAMDPRHHAPFGGNPRCDFGDRPIRGRERGPRFAALRADASDRSADLRVDAAALDHRHVAPGRHHLAGHFLPPRRTAPRLGLGLRPL